jgi:predicted PurR-regulated permease PerM
MTPPEPPSAPASAFTLTFVEVCVGILCLLVLLPFMVPAAWAAILAYATWPLYRRMQRLLHRRAWLAPPLMTLCVTLAVLLPVGMLVFVLQRELADAFQRLTAFLSQEPKALLETLDQVPWVGKTLRSMASVYWNDSADAVGGLVKALWPLGRPLLSFVGGLGWNIGMTLLALLMLYLLYRDADRLAVQVNRLRTRHFGTRLDKAIQSAGSTTRGVFFGMLVTVVAQGAVAGLGYWITGLSAPVLLGVLTGLLSVLPLVGTGLVWVPAAIGLILGHHYWAGFGLLAWGALLVHPIDNILRPLILSRESQLPFAAAFFGILGGISAFGAIGIFAGPIILGIGLTFWREFSATDAR